MKWVFSIFTNSIFQIVYIFVLQSTSFYSPTFQFFITCLFKQGSQFHLFILK